MFPKLLMELPTCRPAVSESYHSVNKKSIQLLASSSIAFTAMNTLNLACAALIAVTMSSPASAQFVNFRRIKNHRRAHLQSDARQARKLADPMSYDHDQAPPPTPLPTTLSTSAPVPAPTSAPPTPTTPPPTLPPTPQPTSAPVTTPTTPPPTPTLPTPPPTTPPTSASVAPTDFPTELPTSESGNPTKKPTRKPTKKPSRKPTRKPTNEPGSSRSYDNCEPIDDEVTIERYDGKEFLFKWNETYGSCVDYDGRLYEYGEFDDVASFTDCAEACLQDVDEKFTKTKVLRGIDYVCESEKDGNYYYEGKCRCLYESGTLGKNSRAVKKTHFDEIGFAGEGVGPVNGTSTEEERSSTDKAYKTLCVAVVGFGEDDGFWEDELFGEVAYV